MKKLVLFTLLVLLTGVSKAQYTATNLITNLSNPIAFTFTPDGRIVLTLKAGVIKIYNNNGTEIGTFYDLTDSTRNNSESGLLGIDVDPGFASNHYIYAYYVHRYPNNSSGTANQQLRVVRFTENNNVGTNPTILFAKVVGTIPGNHVGGNIHFRPSEPDKLYISIGELATQSNAQLLTNPFGKFLRINTDGSIPADNPFYDDGDPAVGNDDRIWSYGHRNPFDFTFSPVNDSLYSTENGNITWDELNIVTHGKNYGWSTCEGYYQQGSTTIPCGNANFTDPIEDWPAPLPAVTGIVHYTSCFMPALTNHLIVGDNDNGYLYDIELGNAPAYNVVNSRTQLLDLDGLTTIRQGTDGYIYALNGGYAPAGKLYKIGPTNPPAPPTAVIITGIVPESEHCVGDTITVIAQESNDIQWYEFTLIGDNAMYGAQSDYSTNILAPTEPGTYDLRLIVGDGCQTDTAFIANYVSYFAPPTYTLNTHDAFSGTLGSAWLSDYANVTYVQWFDAQWNPIGTNDTIENLDPGTYYVRISSGLNMPACMVTDTFNILLDALNEHAVAPVKTYPNPANNRLFIDLKNVNEATLTAQVYNATGALVQTQAVNGKAVAELAIANLPNGIYYLLVNGEKGRYSATWIKQ